MATSAKLAAAKPAKKATPPKKTTAAAKKAPAKKTAEPAPRPPTSAELELERAIAAAAAPPPEGSVPITFAGRDMHVIRPDQGQLALIIDASEWMTKARAQMKKVMQVPPGAGDDHPLIQETIKATERGLRHVGRLQRIIGSLFADPDDWEWVCDQLAEKLITWQEVAALPEIIIKAHNEADRMEPDNRQARRAASRGRRV